MTYVEDLQLPPDLEPKREILYHFLNRYRYRLPFPKPIYYAVSLGLWIVGLVMGVGYLKMNLMLSRDKKPEFLELFANWHVVIPYLLSGICYGLVVSGGMILLIVPGFILMVMLLFYPYLIIDKTLGPIQALKRSRVITKGSRWRLFLFFLLLILLNIGGIFCLLVGLLVTISMSSIAMAYVYDRLEHSPEMMKNGESVPQPI